MGTLSFDCSDGTLLPYPGRVRPKGLGRLQLRRKQLVDHKESVMNHVERAVNLVPFGIASNEYGVNSGEITIKSSRKLSYYHFRPPLRGL